MTGFFRRLSVNPPNTAVRGRFPSRGIVSFKQWRGPSCVSDLALRRLASWATLVSFLWGQRLEE